MPSQPSLTGVLIDDSAFRFDVIDELYRPRGALQQLG
jgi:hypothetical protein